MSSQTVERKCCAWLSCSSAVARYTGCLHPTLRQMSEVKENRLQVGHTFPDIELLKLRIANEANLRDISFKSTWSKIRQIRCYGFMFVVEANNTEFAQGFCVMVCSVRMLQGTTFPSRNIAVHSRLQRLFPSFLVWLRIIPVARTRLCGVSWRDMVTNMHSQNQYYKKPKVLPECNCLDLLQ